MSVNALYAASSFIPPSGSVKTACRAAFTAGLKDTPVSATRVLHSCIKACRGVRKTLLDE